MTKPQLPDETANARQERADDAISSLAEIQRRQGGVITAVLVPGWYWWAVAAGMIAIGAVADTKRPVLLAVVIPVVALAIAALTGVMIFGFYRHVRIHERSLLGPRGAAAIIALDWVVIAVTLGVAFGLRAAGSQVPATIGTIVGAAVLVVAGPWSMRYLRRVMLDQRAGLG